MIQKFIDTIRKYNMLQNGDGVVVGVSGGPDSLTLLHHFFLIKDKYNLKIYAAHVNHNLRGEESDEDQRFVEKVCENWGIPLYIESIDVDNISKEKKMSPEEAGRYGRYKFFERICAQTGANKVAVAQNKNDNAETILMRIMRGTGIEGLAGIKPVRDNIIRPLIEVGRDEIEEYCAQNNLNPRIDSSNLKKIYTRNKIRLELIPYLKKEFNTNIIDILNRMGHLVDGDNNFISNYAKDNLNDVIIQQNKEYIKISREKLRKIHVSVVSRIMRMIIEDFCGNITDIEYVNVDSILEFIESGKTGSSIDLPKGLKLKRNYGEFIILKEGKDKIGVNFSYDVKIPGITRVEEIGLEIKTEISVVNPNIKGKKYIQIFDYDKIKGKLKIRNRQDGDIINPSGMAGTKKLKDYFIDAKFPRDLRDSIPLVALEKEILWIVGYRVSEKYKPDENTKNILVINCIGKD